MTDTAPPQPHPSGDPWKTRLPILTLAHVIGTLHITSLVVMAPVIKDDLALSFAQFGFLVTAYSVGQVTGSLPAGNLADRVGVGWALVIAHGLLTCGALLLTQTTGLWLGMAAMLATGWGYSIMNPSTAKGVFDFFGPERRATAMGIKQTGVPIGGVIAASLGAFAEAGSWYWVTASIAGVTAVSTLIYAPLLERPPSRTAHTRARSPFGSLGEVMRDFNFGRFVAVNALYNIGQQNFFAYLTLFMREAVQVSQEAAGLCYGAAQASSVLGRLGWGAVTDFLLKRRRKFLTIAIGVAAALFLAALGTIDARAGLTAAMALSLLLGLTIASYAPLMQTIAVENVPARLAGSATGYTLVGTYVGSICGPPLFGWIVDVTGLFESGWYLCAALVAAGVALLMFGFRERTA